MKIRLTGTDAECATALVALRDYTPGLRVVTVDGPYLNRADARILRLDLDAELIMSAREADQ